MKCEAIRELVAATLSVFRSFVARIYLERLRDVVQEAAARPPSCTVRLVLRPPLRARGWKGAVATHSRQRSAPRDEGTDRCAWALWWRGWRDTVFFALAKHLRAAALRRGAEMPCT